MSNSGREGKNRRENKATLKKQIELGRNADSDISYQEHPADANRKRKTSEIFSEPIAIMLVNGTASGMIDEPFPDALPVKATQAFQPCHGHANLEFFEADGAFGIIDAILLGGLVGKHPGTTHRDAVGCRLRGSEDDGRVSLFASCHACFWGV